VTEKRWEGEDEALSAISKCSICQLAFFGVISREVEDNSLIQKPSLAALNANPRFDMQPELSKHSLFQSSRGMRNSVKTGTAAIGIIRGSIILLSGQLYKRSQNFSWRSVCYRRDRRARDTNAYLGTGDCAKRYFSFLFGKSVVLVPRLHTNILRYQA